MVRVNALKLGVIAMCLASAAGCSAATSAGPPKNGGSYNSPEDIAEALDQAGLECSGLQKADRASDTIQTHNCTSGDEMVTLRVFTERQDVEGELDAFDGAAMFAGESILAGENWTIVATSDYVEDAHKALGGELVEGG